jgi:hypothetical protein
MARLACIRKPSAPRRSGRALGWTVRTTHGHMKIIIATFSSFLMGICPGLLAQPFTAVGNFGGSFGVMSVNNAATVSFSEFIGVRTYFPIFDQLTLTRNNVGHLYTFTQANDPDFNSIVAVLTDGVSETVGCGIILVPGGGGRGDWPSSLLKYTKRLDYRSSSSRL